MLFSFVSCSQKPESIDIKKQGISHEEGKYPVKFNFEGLYASEKEWNADYDKFFELVKDYDSYHGTLTSAQGVYNYLMEEYFGEAARIIDKLAYYADSGNLMYSSNPMYRRMLQKLDIAYDELNERTAFFYEEMLSLPFKKRVEMFNDPLLEPLKYAYCDLIDPEVTYDTYFASEDEEDDYSYMGKGRMEDLYLILAYTDFVGPEFTLPDGEAVQLSKTSYEGIISGNYDRQTKKDCYDTFWSAVSEYANSFAYILETFIEEQYSYALTDGYESCMDEDLDIAQLPADIIDRVTDVAKEWFPKLHDYYKFYSDHLGEDKQFYFFDEFSYLSPYNPGLLEYDDAVDLIGDALSPLGDDYLKHFLNMINCGFIDVYPDEGKSAGGLSNGGYYDQMPVIELNYNGTSNDVSIFAHEIGHAVYYMYTQENQPFVYYDATVFTHEIASITNELIYLNYLIDNAKSDEERLYYIESELKALVPSIWRELMYQEFENYCYETVEAGEMLTADGMTERFRELCIEYYGPEFSTSLSGEYLWTLINHLYYCHYLFKYATSACYASYIADAISSGDEQMRTKYIEFLKLGASMSPAELLATLGIDIESDDCFEYAMSYFEKLTDEFYKLAETVQ